MINLRSRIITYFFSFTSVISTHYEMEFAGFPVAKVAWIKEYIYLTSDRAQNVASIEKGKN